jgi:hypothetical protein
MLTPVRQSTRMPRPGVQEVALTVKPGGIQMGSRLWVAWIRIALKHEAIALAARHRAQQHRADWARAQQEANAEQQTKHGTDMALALGEEMDAALVGICAAAFALEALSRELEELGAVPQATLEGWRKKRKEGKGPVAEGVTLEILSQTFDMRGLVTRLQGELPRLFEVRGGAVHYEGLFEATRPHPVGTEVSVAQKTYSAENTTRAADLLVAILERCRDKPKAPARTWSHDMRRAINELLGRRGQQ